MNTAVPVHDEVGWCQRTLEVSSIICAAGLIAAHLMRFVSHKALWNWRVALAMAAGALSADLVSGLVHWFCDTWFHESLPFLGRRFLRPFRVHHVNPDDFLRRDPIDTNGDVSMLLIPILGAAWLLPPGSFVSFVFMFSLVSWPTNQVHQWAHMPHPPRVVRALQRTGFILNRDAHQKHHVGPYIENYCIATGWLNRPLAAMRFFSRLEVLVTRITGLQPREDDTAFVRDVKAATIAS